DGDDQDARHRERGPHDTGEQVAGVPLGQALAEQGEDDQRGHADQQRRYEGGGGGDETEAAHGVPVGDAERAGAGEQPGGERQQQPFAPPPQRAQGADAQRGEVGDADGDEGAGEGGQPGVQVHGRARGGPSRRQQGRQPGPG